MFKNITYNFDTYIGELSGNAWTLWLLPSLQIEKYKLAGSRGITLYASWIIFSAELDFSWANK